MTAEEKLKELYEIWKPVTCPEKDGIITSYSPSTVRADLAPKDIDLIANLVVERLKK